jgi:dTDP-4-dehydrorhamnose reductase
MRVLLFGASGMLGFAVHRVLQDSGYDVMGVLRGTSPPDSKWCDGLEYVFNVNAETFDDVARVIEDVRAEVVVNAVGVTLTGSSQADVQRLYAVNAKFPRLLDWATRALGFHLIHFSTDGVFSGRQGMYTETSLPDAVDSYSLSKFLGEPGGERSLVLRTSLIGRGIHPNGSLLDWLLRQSGTVRGFSRAVFSGLPVDEIARVLAHLVLPRPSPLTGLFHLAAQPISKYDLLNLARREWSLDHIHIEPDDSLVIDRSLDGRLLQKTIGFTPVTWEQMMSGTRSFYQDLERRSGR